MGSSLARIDDRIIEHEVRGSGPACVSVPVSWGIDYSLWSHYLAGLEEKLSMVYFNPRGIGGSSRLASPSDCSMDSIVADLERLRKYLGLDRVSLLGHSSGGFSALKYAVQRPDKVRRLVLVATAANTDFEDDYRELVAKDDRIARIHRRMKRAGKKGMAKEELMRHNLALMFSLDFKDYEPFRKEFEEVLSSSKLSPAHLTYHQRIDLPKYDVLDDVLGISCPTLIVAGRHDITCPPKFSKVLRDAIPRSKLLMFEDSSHWPMIEEKDKFVASVVDFVEGD